MLVVLLVVAGTVGSLLVWVRNTGHSYKTQPQGNAGEAQYYREPKHLPLSSQALRAAQITTYNFLRTAVLREHVEDSYALIAPSLRQGLTRERWAKGEIPIVPYPVDLKTVRYQVDYSYATGGPDGLPLLGMDVAMRPKRGEDVPAMEFGIELESAGTGARRHWIVSQWGPRGQSGGEPQGARSTPASEVPSGNSLSTLWLLVPALILSAVILVPIGVGVRSWMRNRRIARTYADV